MAITSATIVVEDNGNNLKTVHITGQLDESNVDEKIQEIYKALEVSPKGTSLIFDFENLEYMNSKSIGYLTDIYGKITENGGKMTIAKARPNILDILQVVGLTQLIQTFESIDEAKLSLTATPEATTVAPAPTTTPTPTPAAQPIPTQTAPSPAPATIPASAPTPAPSPTPAPAQVAPAAPVATPTPPLQPQAPTTNTVAEITPATLSTTPQTQPIQPEISPQAPTQATDTPAPNQSADGGVYKFEQ